MIWLLIAIAWLLLGWLPSRIWKSYLITRYGPSLGRDAWTRRNELEEVAWAVFLGPFGIIACILVMQDRFDKSAPWGWKW